MIENTKCTIKKAVQAIQELNFGEKTCSISRYIKKRIQKNDISKITKLERSDISPTVYSLLQHCQPISASVKRSFSMLRKILNKERNFWIENVKYHLILHFNACMWQIIVGQLLYLENFCAFYLIQCSF